jgi:hypothetical protein
MYICTKLHNQIRIISKLLILFFILNYLNFLFKVDVYIKQIDNILNYYDIKISSIRKITTFYIYQLINSNDDQIIIK